METISKTSPMQLLFGCFSASDRVLFTTTHQTHNYLYNRYIAFMSSSAEPHGILKVPHTIAEGDCVIMYENFNAAVPIRITRGEVHHTRFGAFRHDDMIDRPYGSRVFSINKGDRAPTWLIALAPTPTLWSHTLKHRTQILYPTDIAMVLSELRVRPGSLVLESGTGSGSLSSAFARSVAPTGHLHTFEFNSERVRQARNDFNLLGFGPDLLTVYWRDICAQGFPIVGNGGEVDAIFLDLPTPFADPLLKSLVANLKPRHGRVCSFSPCIEQVQKMCVALAQHGFQELITIECLLCAYDVREDSASIPDLGFGDDSADASVGSKRKSPETDEKTEAEQGKKNVVAVAPTFIGTSKSKVVTVPVQLARGHTGFLTFATYFPLQAAPAATE